MSEPKRYWIFQSKPERFNLRRRLVEGKRVHWDVTRFQNVIDDQDLVFFWGAGDEAGLYGWGTVDGPIKTNNKGEHKIAVLCGGVFDPPVMKEAVKNVTPDLDGLTILRNPTGTNFRVTTLEALAIKQLLEQSELAPPPFPQPDGSGMFPGWSLSEYRYSSEVKRLINATLSYAHGSNQQLFPDALFQVVLAATTVTDVMSQGDVDFFSEAIPEEARSSLWFATEVEWPSLRRVIEPDKLAEVWVHEDVLALIALARRAAILSTGKERIDLRHLIAGMLHGGGDSTRGFLLESFASLNVDLIAFRPRFLEHLKTHYADDHHDAWQRFFEEAEQLSEQERPTVAQLLALLDADATKGRDFLNIKDEVNAFASLLVASDANPPLAIGLFGNWGSGKTFFMKRVRERVDAIAAAARSAELSEKNRFHGRTAQIWFNAWHYSETDLWASLVDHFFNQLKTELVRLGYEEQSYYTQLMERLGLSQDKSDALRAQLEQATAVQSRLLAEQEQLKQQREEKKARRDQPAAQPTPSAIQAPALLNKISKESQTLEQLWGIEGLSAAASKEGGLSAVVELVQESGLLARRLQSLYQGTIKRCSGMTKAVIGFSIAAALIAPVFFSTAIESLLLQFVSFVGFLGVAASQILDPVRKTNATLGLMEEALQTYDQQYSQLCDEQVFETQRLERELAELEKRIKDIDAELKNTQESEQKLKQEYEEYSEGSLFNFVIKRVDSGKYQERLGLLSMVRRDFERLHELMEKQQKADKADKGLPTVDRIVLYIDDLDRCRPERVVQVLEAIHLILAFPLFMVVVGVDARWVGRSLKETYPFLVHRNAKPSEKDSLPQYYAASTEDYLEKIFQIPFWLKQMDSQVSKDLIDGLIKQKEEVMKKQVENEEENDGSGGDGQTDVLDDDAEDEEEGYKDVSVFNASKINLDPGFLAVSDEESGYMAALAGIVGRSPRTVKRYINLYRLFKASNPQTQNQAFAKSADQHRAPMLLLAVVTGRPRSVKPFFSLIKNTHDEDTLSNLLSLQVKPDDEQQAHWRQFLEIMDEFMLEPDNAPPVKVLKKWLEECGRFSYEEWRF